MTAIPPAHIAIVMDGNGRWAKKQRLPASSGHKSGVETVRDILQMSQISGVKCLTLFAFSSENWNRPKLEVRALMRLFSSYLDNEVNTLHEQGVRLRFIGRRDRFNKGLLTKITAAELKTANNSSFNLTLAVDYGGQWDIAQACRAIAKKVAVGLIDADAVNEALISSHVSLADLPMPDLLIRTSGEYRISNFLLWQLAYSEFYFTETLWPDFNAAEFTIALESYAQRERRFGARKTQ